MTSRPELELGSHLLPGLVAVALFVVMAFVFLQTPFAAADGGGMDTGFTAQTEVANVSVADAGANVSIERRDGGIYAVPSGGDGGGTLVTPYTEANVQTVTKGSTVYAVATIQNSVTESLGYALFDLNQFQGQGHPRAAIPSEGFLVAFEIIDVLLVAALVAAVMLARREAGGTLTTALGDEDEGESVATDGGRDGGDR